MKPRRIDFGTESSGIAIEYIKSRNELRFHGHYDRFVGIEGGKMDLQEFCRELGIGYITQFRLNKDGQAIRPKTIIRGRHK